MVWQNLARRQAYIEGTAPEFGESMFQSVQDVKKPDIPKPTTEDQLAQDVDILGMDDVGDDENER